MMNDLVQKIALAIEVAWDKWSLDAADERLFHETLRDAIRQALSAHEAVAMAPLFQKQKFRHQPELGTFGDCDRTCVACLLGVDRDSVPHWGVHFATSQFDEMRKAYLDSRGVRSVSFPLWTDNGKPEEVLAWMKARHPGIFYLLTGTSRNGTNHVVIAKDDAIVWDPALDDSGVIAGANDNGEPTNWFWVEILVAQQSLSGPALSHSERVAVPDGWQSRNDALFIALELCSAELFAQCADQPRVMTYIEQARKALAQEQCSRAAAAAPSAPAVPVGDGRVKVSERLRDAAIFAIADIDEKHYATARNRLSDAVGITATETPYSGRDQSLIDSMWNPTAPAATKEE